ncbi:MAG: outer membrane protein assembly factor BamB [Proteobacteria bacterium]|nr:outer membrane protein assembly factor BamB [Pseudomonadota bacterium]
MRTIRPPVLLIVAALMVAACSKDKNVDQPAKLTPLSATVRIHRVWGASIDDKKAVALRLGQSLALADGRVYAAGHRGDVAAWDLGNGRQVWRVRTRLPLSGGAAASAGLVVVGASDGQLLALGAADGATRWKVRLNGEVLAPAAISDKLIAVRTVDGKLHALSPDDGHELWVQEQQVPRLSLRGTARPVISNDLVISGFDNGKVLAFNSGDGSIQWEATVAPPHGRTELERLSDIDSAVDVEGQNVYAVGFQGRIAMLARDNGQVWWSHELSSYRGLTLDDDMLYTASSDGEIVAFKARTGTEQWRNKDLLHRRLSGVAVMDNTLVVADFQGYVHWLDRATGSLVGRERAGRVRISATPLVQGNMVVVINDRGQIDAYRVTPIGGAAAPAAPAAPAAKPDAEASPTNP